MQKLSSFTSTGALAILAAFTFTIPVRAVVTTVAQYRLGENDPGAASGSVGTDPTVAAAGAPNLNRFGSPVYSDVTPLTSSTLSMVFNGTDQRYAGGIASTLTDNYGMEAWVRSGTGTGNAVVAYNGNTATSGFGLFRLGSTWIYLYGGVEFGPAAPVVPGAWTHLAVVRDSGTSTFYVNGVAVGPSSGGAPNPPAGGMAIGGNPNFAVEFLDGSVDEVRIFSFTPGQFSVSDLNLTAPAIAGPAVPALDYGGLAILVTTLAGLAVWKARAG